MEIICSIILSFILMTKPGHFEVYYKYVLFFAVLLCTLHILIHNSLANVLPLYFSLNKGAELCCFSH